VDQIALGQKLGTAIGKLHKELDVDQLAFTMTGTIELIHGLIALLENSLPQCRDIALPNVDWADASLHRGQSIFRFAVPKALGKADALDPARHHGLQDRLALEHEVTQGELDSDHLGLEVVRADVDHVEFLENATQPARANLRPDQEAQCSRVCRWGILWELVLCAAFLGPNLLHIGTAKCIFCSHVAAIELDAIERDIGARRLIVQ
jgi:hypothetical protein